MNKSISSTTRRPDVRCSGSMRRSLRTKFWPRACFIGMRRRRLRAMYLSAAMSVATSVGDLSSFALHSSSVM
eukprot:2322377-Prymnesium_polylepis.2